VAPLHPLLRLQQWIGNHAVQRLLAPIVIPPANTADRRHPFSNQSGALSGSAVAVQRQPKPQTGAPDPDAERAAAVAEAEAVAGGTTEQLEAQSDAEDALKLNWRKRKDKQYAWSVGLKDKARIQKRSELSPEHQQEITVKIRFFRGEAKAAYIQTISPAVSEFAEPEQVVEMLAEPTGVSERRSQKAHQLSCDGGQFPLEYEGDPAKARCMDLGDPELKNFFDTNIKNAVGYAVEATTWENIEYDRFKVMLVKYRNGTSEYFPLDEVGNFHTGRGVAVGRIDAFLKRENGLVYPMENGQIVYLEKVTPNIIALKNGLKYQIKELQDLYALLQVGGTFTSILGAYGLGANTFKVSINAFRRTTPPRLPGRPLPDIRVKQPVAGTTNTAAVKQLTGEMQGLLKAGGSKKITVQGVEFADVRVSQQGKTLAISRHSTQRVNAPGGHGRVMNQAFEDAAVQVARDNGMKRVTINVGRITNPSWRVHLESHGYVRTNTPTDDGGFNIDWIKTIKL
jgi:hypothetical protein